MQFPSLARVLKRRAPSLAFLCVITLPCLFATAQSDNDAPPPPPAAASPAAKPAPDKTADTHPLPPLPPDAHAPQSITLEGKKLNYTVTVGTLIARDADGSSRPDRLHRLHR
jgi:carboxypeptidase C (cathepsin A)